MSGYKIVNLNEDMKMAAEWEHTVARAYSLDESRTTIQVPPREHLGAEHVPGVCCKHEWGVVNLSALSLSQSQQADWKRFLQQLFDETDLGDVQVMCKHCKAFALADKTGEVEKRAGWPDIQKCRIWAYDASATLPQEQPRKDRPGGRDTYKRGRK